MTAGPLAGVRVVEIAGIGPAPFAAMLLADLGADVIRVDRIDAPANQPETAAYNVLDRNRTSVYVDLKHDAGRELVLDLVARADVLVEGFRPGVAERLGIGPDTCLARNPGLVYGRMTGWGQEGPLAHRAGHDLTYASVAGAIAHIGRRGAPPTPPLNLVADFGGGGMLLVVGVLAALQEKHRSGTGQVVDAAMVDGVSLLMAPFHGAFATGAFSDERGTNLLDSGAPFYDCYRCADGEYVAVGAIERKFFAELVDGLGLDEAWVDHQHDPERREELRQAIAECFASADRQVWLERFDGTDACVAPVLTLRESADHPHLRARGTVVDVDGAPNPAAAPRFSRTPAARPTPGAAAEGDRARALLGGWGVSDDTSARASETGALR